MNKPTDNQDRLNSWKTEFSNLDPKSVTLTYQPRLAQSSKHLIYFSTRALTVIDCYHSGGVNYVFRQDHARIPSLNSRILVWSWFRSKSFYWRHGSTLDGLVESTGSYSWWHFQIQILIMPKKVYQNESMTKSSLIVVVEIITISVQ